MELDFDKTYSNVRFQKWEKFFSFDSWIDEFITDIKNENPEIIIVSDERKRWGDGCYATIIGMFTESKTLKDYSFISKMTNLRQLYIYAGENIVDLKFISELTNLNQLYLAESKIKEIDELVTLLRRQKEIAKNLEGINRIIYGFDAICVNSSEELEGSILLEQGFYVSEIIVNRKWIQR